MRPSSTRPASSSDDAGIVRQQRLVTGRVVRAVDVAELLRPLTAEQRHHIAERAADVAAQHVVGGRLAQHLWRSRSGRSRGSARPSRPTCRRSQTARPIGRQPSRQRRVPTESKVIAISRNARWLGRLTNRSPPAGRTSHMKTSPTSQPLAHRRSRSWRHGAGARRVRIELELVVVQFRVRRRIRRGSGTDRPCRSQRLLDHHAEDGHVGGHLHVRRDQQRAVRTQPHDQRPRRLGRGDADFPSGTKKLTVTLQNGTYDFFCSVPGHKAAGMDVKVTVGGGGAAATTCRAADPARAAAAGHRHRGLATRLPRVRPRVDRGATRTRCAVGPRRGW